MKNRRALTALLAAVLCVAMLAGCSQGTLASTIPAESNILSIANMSTDVAVKIENDDYYFNWQAQTHTTIDLSKGSTTITKSGIYELTGTLSDGSITVNIDKSVDKDTVYLVLNNATINSNTDTPINIIQAKKVTMILENGTTNTVTQGDVQTADENFPSAAIFSKADLTITGSGTLNVTTQYNDGITSKDDLIITDGIFNIKAVGDGIVGKDLLAIEKANINITAGKDGLRSTNSTDADKGNIVIASGTITIVAANDGIQAEKVLQIDGGTFDITTGGGYSGSIKISDHFGGRGMPVQPATTTKADTESKKALKAGTEIIINAGTFTISAYEDAIHSNGNITIENGSFTIESGDDAIHADGTVAIHDGSIDIKHSYEGIEGNNVTISGGKINIVSSDDGLNVSVSTGIMTISGGEIYLESTGDAIDSNGNLTITGGKITINKSTIGQADEAVDYDGKLTFTGGTIVDQNGNTIDPTVRTGPGGGMGGGRGTKPPRP